MLNLLLNTTWQSVFRWFLDDHGPHSAWNMRMSFFLGSHAAELSENAFPRIYSSRKDVHIFMKCTNRNHHTCRQEWIYSCLLKLAVSRPHSQFQDEEGLIGRLTNCTLCTRPPRHPYDLHCLCLFSTGEAGSVLGRGVLCTHTLTHCGRQKRGCNRVDGCWIIFISMEFCSASYCVCCMFLCVCVWTLSAAFPGPWPIRTVIHDKGNCGQPPQCFAPQLPGNRRFPSPLLS